MAIDGNNVGILARIVMVVVRFSRFSAVSTTVPKITEIIRRKVCKFQFEYANYQVLTSRLHREFKKSFEAGKADTDEKYKELERHVEEHYKRLCAQIIEYIQEYFALTHLCKDQPRVGILQADDCTPKGVTSIKMSNTNDHDDNKYKTIDEYPVLKKIEEDGCPVLINDLPKLIKKDDKYKYDKHHGIDVDKIRTGYRRRHRDKILVSRLWHNLWKKNYKPDKKWIDKSGGDSEDYLSTYKSILAVPVTFREHAIGHTLESKIIRLLKMPKDGRAILGIIYIENADTYYFDDPDPKCFYNIDVNVMYVFADLLSLIVLTRLMYIEGSSTVSEYKNSSGDSNV